MATVTGFTAEHMSDIEDSVVVDGGVDGSYHLILVRHDTTTIDAGYVRGPAGANGADGADGADGTNGTNGADGRTVLTTSGVPSSGTGVNGDFAYDPTAKIMYGPKAAGAWPAGVSLVGSAGANGTDYTERSISTQAADYVCVLADANQFIKATKATAQTITIPPQSSVAWAANTVLSGAQYGAGQVTIVAGSGVTLRYAPGLKTSEQYAVWEARRIASDEWLVYGRLAT